MPSTIEGTGMSAASAGEPVAVAPAMMRSDRSDTASDQEDSGERGRPHRRGYRVAPCPG